MFVQRSPRATASTPPRVPSWTAAPRD